MSDDPKAPPMEAMFQLLTARWVTSAVSTAARLGIADLLESGPRSTQELAAAAKVKEAPLYRLLRACSSVGVFHEQEGRVFSQTPMSQLLSKDVAGSLRNYALMMNDEWHLRCWGELPWCVETGTPASFKVYDQPLFEYLTKHPDDAVNFNNAMTDLSMGDGPAITAAYDFSKFEQIADLGGGMGGLLAAILEKNPKLKGTLVDLPYVIEQARTSPMLAPFAARCSFDGASFFDTVPAADAYIMKYIIHDWDDTKAAQILTNCRKAIRAGGKLLVVDRVVGPRRYARGCAGAFRSATRRTIHRRSAAGELLYLGNLPRPLACAAEARDHGARDGGSARQIRPADPSA